MFDDQVYLPTSTTNTERSVALGYFFEQFLNKRNLDAAVLCRRQRIKRPFSWHLVAPSPLFCLLAPQPMAPAVARAGLLLAWCVGHFWLPLMLQAGCCACLTQRAVFALHGLVQRRFGRGVLHRPQWCWQRQQQREHLLLAPWLALLPEPVHA